jgi:NAD(P)-dependent dehydrogenase (short-subunit alcohol dehydrogenase family)
MVQFFSLEAQVAVITGGGRGIGEGIARRFHAAGARVAILDLNEGSARQVARSISGIGMKCDVTSAISVETALSEVRNQLGPIEIVVNNAGITGKTVCLWELKESDLDEVYAVNLKGAF